MNDIFISYSHANRQFVQQLLDAFSKAGDKVWWDQQLSLEAEWWDDIQKHIESANVVLFVLSPESLMSPICHFELAHARQHNKRILPIRYQEVDEKEAFAKLITHNLNVMERTILGDRDLLVIMRDNWQVVHHRQWVAYNGAKPFSKWFDELKAAIGTDLYHTRVHTQLLIKVREWEEAGRDASFLLHGKGLKDAEKWLAQAEHKSPAPTESQCALIAESRRAWDQQQANIHRLETGTARMRRASQMLGAVGGLASAAALLLLIIGLNANSQMTAAQATLAAIYPTQTEIASDLSELAGTTESQRLADLANKALNNGDEHVAVLLGIRALNAGYSAQAEDILAQALYEQRLYLRLIKHDRRVNSAVFSPDGRFLLTASNDQTMILWDITAGRRVQHLRGHSGDVNTAMFSPDGTRIVSASDDDTAIVWDAATGDILLRLQRHESNVQTAVFSPNGQWIATASRDGKAIIWNAQDGSVHQIIDGQAALNNAVYDAAGNYLLTADSVGHVKIWDVSPLQPVLVRDIYADELLIPVTAAFSPSGQILVTQYDFNDSVATGFTVLWDIVSGKIVPHLEAGFSTFTDRISLQPFNTDGSLLITTTGNTVAIWDAETGQALRRLPQHQTEVTSTNFSPNNRWIVTGDRDGLVQLWEADTREFVAFACAQVGSEDFNPIQRVQFELDQQPTCPHMQEDYVLPSPTAPINPTPFVTAAPPVWTALPTLTPTATPALMPNPAVNGENRGELPLGGGQRWTYEGRAGESLNISVITDRPANDTSPETRKAENLLDPLVIITLNNEVLAEDDDIENGRQTDVQIEDLTLPVDGVYVIEVRSYDNETGGWYTLILESESPPTPTAQP